MRLRIAVLASCVTLFVADSRVAALSYPAGFSQTTVFSGLTAPTAVRFAADGRVFVAEKRGLVRVFDSLSDTTPTTVIDVQIAVHDFWDRGLLGLALDPAFDTNGYVYLFYAYDYNPVHGQGPPYWGDGCNDPPGATNAGCVISGRLARFKVKADNTLDGGEQVLLENRWCQQYPSHSIGGLVFDAGGALVLSAGDGASFNWVDYGQGGTVAGITPPNPCGDPPAGVGGVQAPPAAAGGALRSQDLRTAADPLSYDGTVLRVDPATGEALPDNPLYGGVIVEDDRVIAHGLRNPFRIATRPGTSEVWIGDVGWGLWEEIDRIADSADGVVENFGWPCYEGEDKQGDYDSANLDLCEELYAAGAAAHADPFYAYHHAADVDPQGDLCKIGSSAIAGLAFYTGGTYPGAYEDALFFADYARDCIYVMLAGAGGAPDLASRTAFGIDVNNPVDLQRGPGGDLFYVDLDLGRIRRVVYNASNTPPTAVAAAQPTSGDLPLLVQFDAVGSTDPDPGATLFYDWDLDGDGQHDDSSAVDPQFSYTVAGPVQVSLLVTDDDGATDVDTITITPGNAPPSATILAPPPFLRWKVGDAIHFQGSGFDPESGGLPASALHWDVALHHCPGGPGDCHEHSVQSFDGTAAGTFVAPDHEWFSYLEFRLTVTDPGALTGVKSVAVNPLTVNHTYHSVPAGLSLSVSGMPHVAPFSEPAIVGSTITVGAGSPQTLGADSYYWSAWSDGGAASHAVIAGTAAASFTASFAPCQALDPCDGLDNDCDGTVDNAPVPQAVTGLGLSRTALAWEATPQAEGYDVVRGDLAALVLGGGDFAAATTDCLVNGWSDRSFGYGDEPGPAAAWWFLVRATTCNGSGTYDSGDSAQHGARDAEIEASGASCP